MNHRCGVRDLHTHLELLLAEALAALPGRSAKCPPPDLQLLGPRIAIAPGPEELLGP